MEPLLIAVELIVVHMIDGREVVINPKQVTQMSEARDAGDPKKQFHAKVQCIIQFTDGRYLSVAEPCEEVRRAIEKINGGSP